MLKFVPCLVVHSFPLFWTLFWSTQWRRKKKRKKKHLLSWAESGAFIRGRKILDLTARRARSPRNMEHPVHSMRWSIDSKQLATLINSFHGPLTTNHRPRRTEFGSHTESRMARNRRVQTQHAFYCAKEERRMDHQTLPNFLY